MSNNKRKKIEECLKENDISFFDLIKAGYTTPETCDNCKGTGTIGPNCRCGWDFDCEKLKECFVQQCMYCHGTGKRKTI